MTVLSYTNAFPGIPFPNHLSGQSKPQSYLYPGGVQILKTGATTVLLPTNAFPGIAFPNHLSGQSKPQSYLYPGGVQPAAPTPPAFVPSFPSNVFGGVIRRFRMVT
jgi:hypothetical protein